MYKYSAEIENEGKEKRERKKQTFSPSFSQRHHKHCGFYHAQPGWKKWKVNLWLLKTKYFIYLHQYSYDMSVSELKEIKDLASSLIRKKRSREEILLSLQGAGILSKSGKIKEPYTHVFVAKKGAW
jgi:hypothetical protein